MISTAIYLLCYYFYQTIKNLLLLFSFQYLFFYQIMIEVDSFYDRKIRGLLEDDEKFHIQKELYAFMGFSFLYFVIGGIILFGTSIILPYRILLNLVVGSFLMIIAKVVDRALLDKWKKDRRKSAIKLD